MATDFQEIVLPARKSQSPRVWAGALIVLAGLGLLALGGCFLVGVLEVVRIGAREGPLGPEAQRLIGTLYTVAFLCFGAAALLLVIGIWGLYRVLWGSGAE